jgi:hypothetical protein
MVVVSKFGMENLSIDELFTIDGGDWSWSSFWGDTGKGLVGGAIGGSLGGAVVLPVVGSVPGYVAGGVAGAVGGAVGYALFGWW